MEPVNHLNPALVLLRRQLSENIERLRKSGRFSAPVGAGASQPSAPDAAALEAALVARLARIERRSAQGREAATRALVELALLAEFGEGLLTDPAFGAMLGEISAGLREDADIRAELDALIDEL